MIAMKLKISFDLEFLGGIPLDIEEYKELLITQIKALERDDNEKINNIRIKR